MFNFNNRTDEQVEQDVRNELTWDPKVNALQIEVSAKDGIITLNGNVPHYIDKMASARAAQRVSGVKAVVEELKVKGIFDQSDEDIAKAALKVLKWNYSVPENIQVIVEDGWITLTGEAEWEYERNAAVAATTILLGVKGLTNNITMMAKVQTADVKKRIEDALKRSATIESRKITVTVNGDKVTLTGIVHSFGENEDAQHAAWGAPGVMSVENNLRISN